MIPLNNRNDYTGNGATDTYSYTFKIFAEGDLLVTQRDAATVPVETTLVLNTDYTVTGVGSASGGTIVLTAGNLTSNYLLTIRRVRALTQETDVRNQGDFYPEVHEDAFDHHVMIAQQQQDELNRGLRLPETEAGSAASRTLPTDRASKYLAFDADRNPIASAAQSGVPTSAFMTTMLDDETAAEARNTLGPWVDAAAYPSFSDAIDAIGATSATLLIASNQTVSANKTVPANVELAFIQGGSLVIASGKVVTINGGLNAGVYQIFGGSGSVSFGAGGKVYPQWWGAMVDGVTDDYAAINSALSSFAAVTNRGGGTVMLTCGVFKYGTTLTIPMSVSLEGISQEGSVLWYSGTGTAITGGGHYFNVRNLHLTSLDTTTANWMTSTLAGIGTGQTGILINKVNVKIKDVTISYFNKSTSGSEAIAIKTNGTVPFSGLVENCYLRYNWGGISLEDTVTDWSIVDTDIIDQTKFGISIGYDWNAAAQTSFTGDNFRLYRNHIESINRGSNEAASGNGYGIYLSRGALFDIRGNYMEDVYAETASTAYGIYANGVTDGSYLLAIEINSNNIVTAFTGTKYTVWLENCWYGGGTGNHFLGINNGVYQENTSRYFLFGSNFFTGAPATPYGLNGTTTFAYDLVNGKLLGSGDISYDFSLAFGQRMQWRNLTATANDATPAVQYTNVLTTANTSTTAITTFDNGASGQPLTVLVADANTEFTHGSGLILAGAVGWTTSASGDAITFIYNGSDWVETARSDNT
jgi:hypothetical protein